MATESLSQDFAHRLRILDVLDRITQVSLAHESMEEVMRGVLDLVLKVFNADRAWFLYPCDPSALSWGVPMERTLPEWPGLFARGTEIPMNDELAKIFGELLRMEHTIQYGPATDHPVPQSVADAFAVKTQLMIALKPKIDKAWVFGLHHCKQEMMHSEDDIHLFTVIAQRIADCLSGLISIRQLRESEEQLRAFLDNSAVIGWLKDEDGRYVFASDNLLRRFNLEREDVIGKTEQAIWPAAAGQHVSALHDPGNAAGKTAETVKAMVNPDQSISWWLSNEFVFRTSHGKRLHGGLAVDITARKLAEQQLHVAAAAFEAQEGILITDADNIILRVNRSFTQITGYSAEEVIGKHPRIFKSGRHNEEFYKAMWESINHTGSWHGEIWNRRKNGETFPERILITAVKDPHGNILNYVSTITDFTMSKEAADEIRNLAFYDPLTTLPNRRLLMDRLAQALAASKRNGRKGALLIIDMDNFKALNDTLGHDAGDLLLQQAAQRLLTAIREGDTIARFGGDEFVAILEGLSPHTLEAAQQTEIAGENILALLNQPYQLLSHEYRSAASIGITLFEQNHQALEEVIKQADIALFQAKKSGRNNLRFYDPQMQKNIAARVAMEQEFRRAFEQQQFQLYYQPQVDRSKFPLGAEALLRWTCPQRGLLLPGQIISLAEETGLILSLGSWVLERGCAQISQWQQQESTSHLVLAINISARQFHQANFATQVQAVMQRYQINPARLKLELTESVMLANIPATLATMNALNEIGVQLALDNFGTGYSSLQYLKLLPFSQLNIDQSFIRDIDRNDNVIVRAIIAIAQSLGLNVLAEGVDSELQWQFLLNNGCNDYQGDLFGKAMPMEEFESWLAHATGQAH